MLGCKPNLDSQLFNAVQTEPETQVVAPALRNADDVSRLQKAHAFNSLYAPTDTSTLRICLCLAGCLQEEARESGKHSDGLHLSGCFAEVAISDMATPFKAI